MGHCTVHYNQDELLKSIIELHCEGKIDADLTYGNGGFYKNIPSPVHCFDIEPLAGHVKKASSDCVPLDTGAIDSLIFDPPFLTYVKNGRKHAGGRAIMSARFGGYWRYEELEKHYKETLREASRLLRKKGIMVFKCQDIIHNHKMHASHINVVNWAQDFGFRLKDLFILAAKHRMTMPETKGCARRKQRHARVYHSYFLVLELTSKKAGDK